LISLASWSFLPLINKFSIVLIIPILSLRYLLNDPLRWGLGLHYSGVLSLVCAWGFVAALSSDKNLSQKFGISKILIFTVILEILVLYHFSPNLNLATKHSREASEIESILALIPENASVSAVSSIVPHLSTRSEIYLFPNGLDETEYIILTLDRNTYPLTWNDFKRQIHDLNNNPNYKLINEQGSTYLFQKVQFEHQ